MTYRHFLAFATAIPIIACSGVADQPSPIPKTSLVEFAKNCPDDYHATWDYKSLPTIASLDGEKSFTGDIFVLNKPKYEDKFTLMFRDGKCTGTENEKAWKWAIGMTIAEVQRKLGRSTDMRWCRQTSFYVSLPKDLDKLNGFKGELTSFTKDHKFLISTQIADDKVIESSFRETLR